MGDRIFWFSGSGNSLYAAKRIGEALENVEVLPIPSAMNSSIPESNDMETLYIVFPIYGWGPPRMVEQFVNLLPQNYAKKAICIYTYGGDAGPVSKFMKKLLKKKDIPLQASFGIKTVDNYPPFGGAPSGDKLHADLKTEEEQIQSIVKQLKESPEGNHEHARFMFKIIGRLVQPLFRLGLRSADNKYWINDKCNNCGICSKLCPTKNITINDDGPKWGGNCEQCFACFHWCPEKAVEYGKNSAPQPRYMHPDIKLKDIIDGNN